MEAVWWRASYAAVPPAAAISGQPLAIVRGTRKLLWVSGGIEYLHDPRWLPGPCSSSWRCWSESTKLLQSSPYPLLSCHPCNTSHLVGTLFMPGYFLHTHSGLFAFTATLSKKSCYHKVKLTSISDSLKQKMLGLAGERFVCLLSCFQGMSLYSSTNSR